MELVKSTGLSYGKIYRILNGTLENPSPAYIKKLSNSLGLDYTYLLEVSGVIQPKIKTHSNQVTLPMLTWEYCLLAFPFSEGMTTALSDEHVQYHEVIKDGFALTIDDAHQLYPYYVKNDIIICDPHKPLAENNAILYLDIKNQAFKFGIIVNHNSELTIQSLHQDSLDTVIPLSDSVQYYAVATVVGRFLG